MELGLTEKRALVTGGASGIGCAIAAALEREGAVVAIVDRNAPRKQAGSVFVQVELGEEAAAVRAVHEASTSLGGVDLLVNAAAVAWHEPVMQLTPAAWSATFAANLDACVWTCREAARSMVASGGGSILIVGSTSVYTPAVAESAYRCSKAALRAWMEVLALELSPFHVRVNMLTPGAFGTPLTAGMGTEQRARLIEEIPLRREGQPGEICATALLLLSDRLSPYTTGAEFVVDGGLRLRPLVSVAH